MGVSWIPLVFVGFLAAVLLTAISPRNSPFFYKNKRGSIAAENQKTDIDVFFWILIFCLALLALGHFFWFPQFGWR
jgi:hypothetical protein